MKLAQKIVLHLIIILIVIIFPVIVYTFMSNHGYNDFAFIGGLSYFIYAFYVVFKIKNQRTRIILLGILSSILILIIGIALAEINMFIFFILLGINLIFQFFLLIKNPRSANSAVWKSYLISFVISLILSVLFTLFWFLMLAASGLPSNHY
jgi:hypothetical protein